MLFCCDEFVCEPAAGVANDWAAAGVPRAAAGSFTVALRNTSEAGGTTGSLGVGVLISSYTEAAGIAKLVGLLLADQPPEVLGEPLNPPSRSGPLGDLFCACCDQLRPLGDLCECIQLEPLGDRSNDGFARIEPVVLGVLGGTADSLGAAFVAAAPIRGVDGRGTSLGLRGEELGFSRASISFMAVRSVDGALCGV